MNKEPAPSSDPARLVSGELRELVGRLKRRLRNEAGDKGLSLSQLAVLGRLYRCGSATVTALARVENVRSQSMGSTVASLQAMDLIITRPDPDDGRRTLLSLTPAARKRLEASRAARNDWLDRAIQERLDAEEQQILAHAVKLLQRITES